MINNQEQLMQDKLIQDRFFSLLVELKNLCEENNISFFLHKKLLSDALAGGEISGNYREFAIAMDPKDIKRFIRIVDKKKDRELDYICVNPYYMDLSIRYVDTTTLYWRPVDWMEIKYPGVWITIEPFRMESNNKFVRKIQTLFVDGFIQIQSGNYERNKKSTFSRLVYNMLGIFGEMNRAKLIFKCAYGIGEKRYFPTKKKNKIRKIIIHEKDINSSRRVILNGETFRIVDNKAFLSKVIGIKYGKQFAYSKSIIVDLEFDLMEFIKKISDVGLKNKEEFRKYKELKQSNKKMNQYKSYVQKCWNLLYRTRDRFEMQELYKSRKKDIVLLYNRGENDLLGHLLEENINMMKKYSEVNLGFAFDPVIFSITIEYLIQNGKSDEAKKYEKLIAGGQLRPLEGE